MKILQVSPQISFPPDSGGRLSIYGITKSLAELGHDITFVCYTQEKISSVVEKELRNICHPFFINYDISNKISTAILNLFSDVPYNIYKYYSSKMEKFIIEFLNNNQVDVIHVDHLHMAWVIDVIRKHTNIPVVLREHNLEMKIMKRYAEKESNLFIKSYANIQYKKFLLYEPNQCEKFSSCIMITEEDERSLIQINSKVKTRVIPVGVDKKIFELKRSKPIPYSIFHIGSLDWQPNYDGLMWFLSDVFPFIVKKYPNTKVYIYSKGTERLKIQSQFKDNIIIHGYAINIWDEVLDKQLMVVPLRVGSGMRVKIVEMLGAGQLIVSTSIGKEGIKVEDNKHIIIADDQETFIQKIIDIFENKIDINFVISNAQNVIKEEYSWEKIAREFEKVYKEII